MCLSAGLIVLLAVHGCAASGANRLAGSEWRPLSIDGVEAPADAEVFVHFGSEGKLTGNTGCNGFFGGYAIDGDGIEIGPVGTTLRICPGALAELESSLLQALQTARRFTREQTELTLFDADGRALARFRQTDWD